MVNTQYINSSFSVFSVLLSLVRLFGVSSLDIDEHGMFFHLLFSSEATQQSLLVLSLFFSCSKNNYIGLQFTHNTYAKCSVIMWILIIMCCMHFQNTFSDCDLCFAQIIFWNDGWRMKNISWSEIRIHLVFSTFSFSVINCEWI